MPSYEEAAFQNAIRQGRLEDITPTQWESFMPGASARVQALLRALKADPPTDPLTGRKVVPGETGSGISVNEILSLLSQWSSKKSDEQQAKDFAADWKDEWEGGRAGPITWGTTGIGGIGGIPTPEQAASQLKEAASYLQNTLTPAVYKSYEAAQPTGESSVIDQYTKAFDQWQKGEITSEQLMAIGRGESPPSPATPSATSLAAAPAPPGPSRNREIEQGLMESRLPSRDRGAEQGLLEPNLPPYATPPSYPIGSPVASPLVPTPTQERTAPAIPRYDFSTLAGLRAAGGGGMAAAPEMNIAPDLEPPGPPVPAMMNVDYWTKEKEEEKNPFAAFRKKGIQV